MRVLLWIVRAIAILLLIRMILHALFGKKRASMRGRAPGAGAERVPERTGGELVRDPTCGTYVPKARAIIVGSGDEAKYFCSTDCRDKYQR